jgi:hypothetical protein
MDAEVKQRIDASNALAQAWRQNLHELSEAGHIDVGVAVVALCDVLGDLLAGSAPRAIEGTFRHIRRRAHRAAQAQRSPIAAPTVAEVATHG